MNLRIDVDNDNYDDNDEDDGDDDDITELMLPNGERKRAMQ